MWRDYSPGPIPTHRFDPQSCRRLRLWWKSRTQERLPDRRATAGMVKTDRRQELRVFPFQRHRASDAFLDSALRAECPAIEEIHLGGNRVYRPSAATVRFDCFSNAGAG